LSWAETDDDAPEATDRHIVDAEGHTMAVRTSRHAIFATRMLPRGSGSIDGVLSRFNGEYRLILRRESDAIMRD
jgi:hypothetical protein